MFISFEGIDHCGKRTQMQNIKSWLEETTGKMVFCFSEPNDETPIGKHIRKILKGEIPFPGDMEIQRMFALGQAQDWECYIKPALASGAHVLLERYVHSTLAYSLAAGLDLAMIRALHMNIVGSTFRWPDLTVFLDVSVPESMRRIAVAKDKQEHFEEKKKLKKAHHAYQYLFANRARFGHLVCVNGERSVEKVTEEIKEIIKSFS